MVKIMKPSDFDHNSCYPGVDKSKSRKSENLIAQMHSAGEGLKLLGQGRMYFNPIYSHKTH